MSNNIKDLIKDVVASPLGDVIASVGEGVAEAQRALDEGSLATTLSIYAEENGDEILKVLKEIGYRPTFYALPETTGEVRVSLQLGNATQASNSVPQSSKKTLNPSVAVKLSRMGINTSPKPRLYASMVDGGYANRYSYQANVSAKLTFKIVPVPPPEGVEDLRYVPEIIGKTFAEATTILQTQGLTLVAEDNKGKVIEKPSEKAVLKTQQPAANQITSTNEDVVVTLV